jgi:hypothetical protein
MSDDHTRVQAFVLTGFSGTPTRGTLTIRMFEKPERMRRALLALGKWWGVALLSVFIPVAHFLLVPSFFLYGIWELVQRLGTAEVALPARGTCPDCGTEQPLDLGARWRVPQEVTCRKCGRGLTLSAA